MSRITAIRAGKNAGKLVNLFLDGRLAFRLEAETVAGQGLYVGQELSDHEIETLSRAGRFARCLSAATHFLGYRPRSEFELRERLHQRGFEANTIEAVLARLREQGLVNDVAFAQFWMENREAFSPRSRWLTRHELRKKGVPTETIEEVTASFDDSHNAYRAASSKARRLSRSDYQDFRRRLGEHLKRRGFSYDIISQTVKRLWQEVGGPEQETCQPASGNQKMPKRVLKESEVRAWKQH